VFQVLGRIVEISENDRFLSISRGFLVVSHQRQECARIPLDDIAALVANSHGLSYSNNVLIALAERGVPLTLCGANHRPAAIVWPVEQHYLQAGRIHAQAKARRPLKKQLWRQIVQRKLLEQAAVLHAFGKPFLQLTRLAATVKSGDPGNLEAQGARHYWLHLLGKDFRRNPDLDGANALLNYGYTVLRAATARAVVSVGLHPSLGVFHRNPENSFQLVDDLMESYRPLVDSAVYMLISKSELEINKGTKRTLALQLYRERRTEYGSTPIIRCIELTAQSLADAFYSGKRTLVFPDLANTAEIRGPNMEEDFNAESTAVGISPHVAHRNV
jgi:CRISP-associated protein Cas1